MWMTSTAQKRNFPGPKRIHNNHLNFFLFFIIGRGGKFTPIRFLSGLSISIASAVWMGLFYFWPTLVMVQFCFSLYLDSIPLITFAIIIHTLVLIKREGGKRQPTEPSTKKQHNKTKTAREKTKDQNWNNKQKHATIISSQIMLDIGLDTAICSQVP